MAARSEVRVQPPERADIFVVHNEALASSAVRHLLQRTQDDLKVFGLDCEWNLVTKKGQAHKPDILQIATVHGFCAIFRLHLLKKIPQELKGFLEDPYYAKVGVGVVEDCDKLNQSFDVATDGAVDIRYLADELNIMPKGLSHLTKTVLGVDLTKHHHSFHHWTGNLSGLQKQYAALDAIYPARLFYKLSHDRLSQMYGEEWRAWTPEEYHERTLAMWDKYVLKPFEFSRCKYFQNELVEMMMSYTDLATPLRGGGLEDLATMRGEELQQENCSVEVGEKLEPGELPAFPTFKAKFASNRKEKKKLRYAEKAKRIPMRYFRNLIRRYQREGIDPMTIPREQLPVSVIGADGQLDIARLEELLIKKQQS